MVSRIRCVMSRLSVVSFLQIFALFSTVEISDACFALRRRCIVRLICDIRLRLDESLPVGLVDELRAAIRKAHTFFEEVEAFLQGDIFLSDFDDYVVEAPLGL